MKRAASATRPKPPPWPPVWPEKIEPVIAGILKQNVDVHENQQHQKGKLGYQGHRVEGNETHVIELIKVP